jgi:hypothetical protein
MCVVERGEVLELELSELGAVTKAIGDKIKRGQNTVERRR